MSNTSHCPWRYWCYYTCLLWDLHKQIRRFPQIFRKPKSLCGNLKNMQTSRTRWIYCTNSINHKEMTICAEDQNRMDLVDILCSYCTNSMLADLLHKNAETNLFLNVQVFFEVISDAVWWMHRWCIDSSQSDCEGGQARRHFWIIQMSGCASLSVTNNLRESMLETARRCHLLNSAKDLLRASSSAVLILWPPRNGDPVEAPVYVYVLKDEGLELLPLLVQNQRNFCYWLSPYTSPCRRVFSNNCLELIIKRPLSRLLPSVLIRYPLVVCNQHVRIAPWQPLPEVRAVEAPKAV